MSMITRLAVAAVALATVVGCAATNEPESTDDKGPAANDNAPRISVYAEDPRSKGDGEEAKAGQISPAARMVCRTMWCCDAAPRGPGECYRCTVCD